MASDVMQTSAGLFIGKEAAAILTRLRRFLASQKIEGFVVGGYIRDGLLERPSHDIDLTLAGDAVQIARQVADAFNASFVLLDETHQVARVVLSQDGERWYLDFATIRGSIENDLAKRDFTINAIGMKLGEIEAGWNQVALIDPLEGLRDLEQKAIRAVSDTVFLDDPARLLRAFRFSAELGFSLDSQTEALIERDRGLIAEVSGERIQNELCCILETDRAADSLSHLDQLGLLDLIVPEMVFSKGVEQPKEHFWNVFEHSLETVSAVERLLAALEHKGDLLDALTFCGKLADHFNQEIAAGRTRKGLIKLAALLHDVAKPQTKRLDETGRIRFLGHAEEGALITESILERLRFSSRETRMVAEMVEHHLRPGHLSNASELPTRRAIYRYFRDTGEVGIDVLFLSLADHLATRGPLLEMKGWQEHVEVTQYMLAKFFEDKATVSPPKLIDGHVLMEKFGLVPGPQIGRLLEAVREAQASGEIGSEEDAFDFVRKELGRKHDA
ncbi:MAG: HD domain-containing protein [Dehalococcoidia bacterium]|nr:HD domain-containing protein [Dehalococcoidia bacterium]